MFQVPTLLILVLGLTVATCVIAYWSDNLGKNLGKKRISLLGLRPRQTASLISMVSSVGIMLLTLIALMLSFRNFRHALLRYDRVNEERKIAEQQTEQLQDRLSELNGELNKLQQQVVSRQKHADAAEKRASAADKRAVSANQKLNQTQARLTNAQSALSAAQSARVAAQRGEAAATRQATQAQARLSRAQARFVQAQYRLNQRQNQLRTVNSQLAVARRDVKQQEAELKKTRSQVLIEAAKVAGGYKEVAFLTANLEKQQEEVKTLEAQREKLQDDVRREEEQVNQYRMLAAEYRRVAASLASDNLAVSLGQLFAEATIPSGIDAGQARAALRRLLDEGATVAEKLGARPYKSRVTGITRALHLAPLPVANNEEFNEEEIITHFANHLTGFDVPVSVRLVAARNYAQGETPFLGILQYVPVRRVFGPGEEIVSATIDGSQTDALIFNRLLALLNQGEGVAHGRGVQPVPTEENPYLYATGTNERIFDALRRIQSIGGPANVSLEAAEDLSTVEPMRVRFVVSPMGTSS